MATLILTTIGTVAGGPIGGALGAIVGQQIDNQLFAPKARQGPRLGDLAVQTSSYGTQIPKIFGTMRVAGTVIWATDLKEEKTKSGGGKGQPKTVNYSYSVCFAVALSGRRIKAVRRIWADGKLLRGSAGDFKTETGFRLYLGDEEQAADPLIAAIEGGGRAPAHRGLAYAVFEHFQLGDYGNRIPSLTFEVVADEGSVPIGSIAKELSGETIDAAETATVSGYAASGDGIRGAIEPLADVMPLSLSDDGTRLTLRAAAVPASLIDPLAMVAESRPPDEQDSFSRKAAGAVPTEVTFAYHDVDRDYQTGLQRATRGGVLRAERKALPLAATADQAKGFAEAKLAQLWSARETGKINLALRSHASRPGDCVRFGTRVGSWRVTRWTLEGMVARLEIVRQPVAGGELGSASAGRPVVERDLQHGPTRLLLFDLPAGDDQLAYRPHLIAAAAGVEAGWRKALLSTSYDRGRSWELEGVTAGAAIMGRALTELGPAGSALIDLRSSVEVELLNEGMWLEGRDDDALVSGANLCVVGNELLQFGRAEPLGPRRFRLTRLLRGRRGTEASAIGHRPGDAFLLLERDKLMFIEPAGQGLGAEARLMAESIGDAEPAFAAVRVNGAAFQPPSPVHLQAIRAPTGDLLVRWVRRSRAGWIWQSGSDTPLGEEAEAYRLVISGAGFHREVELSEPAYLYTAALQLVDGAAIPLHLEVVQIGTHAPSRAAQLILN